MEIQPENNTMTHHTPGPWKTVDINPYSGTYEIRNTNNKTVAQTFYTIPDEEMESVFDDCVRCHHGNNLANARLIAAAPELLEALEDIYKRGYEISQHEMVRKAIKQARGE